MRRIPSVLVLSLLLALGCRSALNEAVQTATTLTGTQDQAEQVQEKKEEAQELANALLDIPVDRQIQIGREMAATVAGRYGLVRDEALTRYVNLVGATVATADPRPGVLYRFAVLDTDEVNAMATPGGYVFVTRGALEIMEDEAMLAGVLAHEIAHVHHEHITREIERRSRTQVGWKTTKDKLNLEDDDVLHQVATTGTNKLFVGLGREDELEADRSGTALVAAAGYDPTGLRRFLEALDGDPDRVHWLLGNDVHPERGERLSAIDEVLPEVEAGPGVLAAERFRGRRSPQS